MPVGYICGQYGGANHVLKHVLVGNMHQMETFDDEEAEAAWTRVDRTNKFQNVKEFNATQLS